MKCAGRAVRLFRPIGCGMKMPSPTRRPWLLRTSPGTRHLADQETPVDLVFSSTLRFSQETAGTGQPNSSPLPALYHPSFFLQLSRGRYHWTELIRSHRSRRATDWVSDRVEVFAIEVLERREEKIFSSPFGDGSRSRLAEIVGAFIGQRYG